MKQRTNWRLEQAKGWCRVCGATIHQRAVAPEQIARTGQWFHRCGCCGNGYLAPDLGPDELDHFYREEYRRLFPVEAADRYDEAFLASLKARQIARQRADRLGRDLPPAARILEIGSGFGTLLAALHQDDPTRMLVAVEPDANHRTAGLNGAPVQFLNLKEALAAGPYDLVLLFHTLEHVVDPADLLRNTHSALTATGRLVIEVPDVGADWSGWQDVHLAHLSYFTGPGLDRLTARCGFETMESASHLPGTLWRLLIAGKVTQPIAAQPEEIAAFDKHLARYPWRRRDSLKRFLKGLAIKIFSAETVGGWVRARRPPRLPQEDRRALILGHGVDRLTFPDALEEACTAMRANRPCRYADLNVAKLIQMRKDPQLAAAVASADRVCADGMGIVWGLRLLGRPVPERVTGIDLMQSLLQRCAKENFKPFLLGATPDVLADASAKLTASLPDLTLAGQHHGYFSHAEEAEIVARIRASDADCLIVAMGSPLQELFLERHHAATGVPFAMMVGGSLDVIAGRFRRAPLWMQRAGLEWLARLLQDPLRLGRRYFVSNSLFLLLLVGAWIRQKVRP
ncbi:WecB/TagA/CpsF family glycosyltransferase [Lacibacterium aquatile]|uniref:WecB/TagA/CpsF family glycosyltransferase n=1 Tax=Lacibacterium aquatile TaxID=1168082 RepID=A0ABW5DU93_9PROT